MAATSDSGPTIRASTMPKVLSGYWQSDWQIAHSDTSATAATAALLLNPGSTSQSTNVRDIPIPEGATRVVLRQRTVTSVTGSTTVAVVRAFVLDDSSVPVRIDNPANTAAGISLTFNTTVSNNLTDGSFYYGDPSSIAGIDTMAGKKLRVLVETAAGHTAAGQVVQGLFLNA